MCGDVWGVEADLCSYQVWADSFFLSGGVGIAKGSSSCLLSLVWLLFCFGFGRFARS